MKFLYENLYAEGNYTKKKWLEVLKTKSDFNIIEMVWANLKQNLRRRNNDLKTSAGILPIIDEECANIKSETWNNCIRQVKEIENTYRNNFVNDLVIV